LRVCFTTNHTRGSNITRIRDSRFFFGQSQGFDSLGTISQSRVNDVHCQNSSLEWDGISQVDLGMQTIRRVLGSRAPIYRFVEGNEEGDDGENVITRLTLNSESCYH